VRHHRSCPRPDSFSPAVCFSSFIGLQIDGARVLKPLGWRPSRISLGFRPSRAYSSRRRLVVFMSTGPGESLKKFLRKVFRASDGKNEGKLRAPWALALAALKWIQSKFDFLKNLRSNYVFPSVREVAAETFRVIRKYLTPIMLMILFVQWRLTVIPSSSRPQPPPEVTYAEFLEKVESNKVETCQVNSNSNSLMFTLKGRPEGSVRTFVCGSMPLDFDLIRTLRAHRVKFGSPVQEPSSLLGTLVGFVIQPLAYALIWYFIMRVGGGPSPMSVGKSKARLLSEGKTGVTFEDVAGVDEAKEELQEIVEFLKQPDKFLRLGARIPRGVLLVGPAGTGKTLLARAVAGEAGVPFFSISASEFVEMFVGVGAARVRDLFAQAKKQAPCIVFIDELDALGRTRGDSGPFRGNDEREQTLNQLLTEMDGFEGNKGVIVLAATNRPEVLDPALRRPGRFDRQVIVDRPDRLGRLAILKVHSQSLTVDPDVNLEKIAARTTGFAGADLANLINEGALLAARRGGDRVRMADLMEAIERVVAGIEKKSRVLNEMEKRVVAFHETGHALVGALVPNVGRIEKISVVPRGISALGYTMQMAEEDRFLMTEEEVRGRICTFLGGRASEEIVFGKVTTGASDDIQGATDMAERAITLYGMCRKIGPVALQKMQSQQFLDPTGGGARRAVSSSVSTLIDAEIKSLIHGAHHLAIRILRNNRDLLETIATDLMTNEVLEGDRLTTYLSQAKAPEELNYWLRTGELPPGTVLEMGYDSLMGTSIDMGMGGKEQEIQGSSDSNGTGGLQWSPNPM